MNSRPCRPGKDRCRTVESCDNTLCEFEAFKKVRVSVERAGDETRNFCASCEEAFSTGVQHGRIVTEETRGRQLKEKDRIIKAQARALRRIRKESQFSEEDGAMDLGERLLQIERLAALALDLTPVKKET